MRKTLVLTALLSMVSGALASPSAVAQAQGTLTVQVSGVRDRVGQVCLKVFAAGQPFPEGPGVPGQAKCVPIPGNTFNVQFENLAYGTYAIAAYHDRNQDGQLNQGPFGIPLEGIGFSNNPRLEFGPPSFESAQTNHRASQSTVPLKIRYFQ